jgi:hypothetical protein
LLIRIIFFARLELDRHSDGYAVGVPHPTIAHDGETHRWIDRRTDGAPNCGEQLIFGRFVTILNPNEITDFTIAVAAF